MKKMIKKNVALESWMICDIVSKVNRVTESLEVGRSHSLRIPSIKTRLK